MNNSTELDPNQLHPGCLTWGVSYGALFHAGNIVLGMGFVIPQSYAYSLISYRAMMLTGLTILCFWAASPSACNSVALLAYSATCAAVNAVYFLHLAIKQFPVYIPKHQRELYKKVFKPWKISRRSFHHLMRDSEVEYHRAGRPFAVEGQTDSDGQLRILLTGKLAVKCDETFLHFVQPMEFVNSIEWKADQLVSGCGSKGSGEVDVGAGSGLMEAAKQTEISVPRGWNTGEKYQVTIDAVNDCRVLRLPKSNLRRTFDDDSDLEFVVGCIISKDVTRKLYMINDNVYSASKQRAKSKAAAAASAAAGASQGNAAPTSSPLIFNFQRTNSLDAIHTGCKGMLRSRAWMKGSEGIKEQAEDSDRLVVINFLLDVPPPLTHIPHTVPVQTLDRSTINEAAFISQQRKYWPAGII